MSPKLNVITVSTRPGRVGPSVANWFRDFATAHGKFDVRAVDLAEFALPVYDEPNHPVMQKYVHEHTKRWAASVAEADAYVFVLPEYNFNPPPSFYNALNYVYKEWNYKPAGFVSYGGASGGLRATQMAKQLVTTLKMMPMYEGVMVPMVAQQLDEQRNFRSNELIDKSAGAMLDELLKWATAMKPMRG
ncbi:NAD(P)H-dependent oxidoreductase [Burkholderiaceae bacterium FT117]|uniref:NADPH-dependent FMN reductase n=1 Tax=Zeimonas sediminis TaxID=2944268 RepID=UPI002342F924|nr:NADPH-dependent FMN reductase [Zeimonas sediminis]MCM5571010.1 NAD(P)H-dependent oxidoreductase [Zeimonas sediminis]